MAIQTDEQYDPIEDVSSTLRDGMQRGTVEALKEYFEKASLRDGPSNVPILLATAQKFKEFALDDGPIEARHLDYLRFGLASVPTFDKTGEEEAEALEAVIANVDGLQDKWGQAEDLNERLAMLLYSTLEVCRAIRIDSDEITAWRDDPEKKIHREHAEVFHYWVDQHKEITFDDLLDMIKKAPQKGRLKENLLPLVG